MATRRLHLESKPEEVWPDNGCEVAPRCLECPLPRCKYDDPLWRLHQRDQQIMALWKRSFMTIPELAASTGMSERSIFRILAKERRGAK